jgi:hypothetical protein
MTKDKQATSTPIKARDLLSVLLKKMHHGVGPTRVNLQKGSSPPSNKQQATSNKQQATSNKQQATSKLCNQS